MCCKLYRVLWTLTFKRPGWYVNFSAWSAKKVLFEQKKVKNVEIKTRDYAAGFKHAVNLVV